MARVQQVQRFSSCERVMRRPPGLVAHVTPQHKVYSSGTRQRCPTSVQEGRVRAVAETPAVETLSREGEVRPECSYTMLD